MAQTNISGDLVGTVSDPAGAAIPNATVTITSTTTGSTKTVVTSGRGDYRIPLLEPGDYSLTIAAAGFEGAKSSITIIAGTNTSGNFKLTVGKATTTVDVSTAQPLLHTEDAQVTTSFSLDQIQNLPNPGNDLTFVAQTSPGAVMNTQGGYGNFSVFGLPATSNTFTVNGGYENDPFLNLNNSGASNLLLGNNDVDTVTVTSNAFDAAFGGLGGAQVSEISRSGGNGFHGNADYWYNGTILNSNDYFQNQQSQPRIADVVNQWAAGGGGPIKKDKSFFFVDWEGLRVVLPAAGLISAPSTAFQDATLATLQSNGNQAEIPLYKNLFSTYNAAPNYGKGVPDPNDPNAVVFPYVASTYLHEWLLTGRIDQNFGQNDKLFGHFEIDKGVQPTYTDPLNPIFSALSPQPQYQGQLNETHTFTPALTNQFLFSLIYYRAIFTNTNQGEANALFPFALQFLDGDFGGLGGEDYVFPQGRNVTGYQFQDDLSWTKGNHTFTFGWAMRRDDVTDFDPGVFTTPLYLDTENSFEQGYLDYFYQQNFSVRPSQPVALYNMGAYVQDTWKALPNLTVTYGIRLEHNSNITCITNCYRRLNGDFYNLDAATDVPLNTLITGGEHRAFNSLQHVGYEPRVGFAWLPFGPGSRTTLRGGFGMFADAFPGQIADSLLSNAPNTVSFGTVLGPAFGGPNYLIDPSLPGSAGAAVAAANQAFQSGFNSGATEQDIGIPLSLSNAAQKISYPTYEEYSLAAEHQVNRSTSLSAMYVGNHSYHQPIVNNGLNMYGPVSNANTGPIPGFSVPNTPQLPAFGTITQIYSGGSSNYNGLIASVTNHSRYLTLQGNYAFSHALDEVSNGGFNSFGVNSVNPYNPFNLSQNYGNADYDTRHYVSGSYVFTLPYWGGPKALTDGWQAAGTVFHNTGYPFTVTDGNIAANNYGGSFLAAQTVAHLPGHCSFSSGQGIYDPNPGAVTQPCPYANDFVDPTNFGQSRRNQLYGPGFTDTDLDVSKQIRIPGWESAHLRIAGQFFNLFNHPNFAIPAHNLSGGSVGYTSATVSTPTSILGAFFTAPSSRRLIQGKLAFEF
jgi:hypothetical protein